MRIIFAIGTAVMLTLSAASAGTNCTSTRVGNTTYTNCY